MRAKGMILLLALTIHMCRTLSFKMQRIRTLTYEFSSFLLSTCSLFLTCLWASMDF